MLTIKANISVEVAISLPAALTIALILKTLAEVFAGG